MYSRVLESHVEQIYRFAWWQKVVTHSRKDCAVKAAREKNAYTCVSKSPHTRSDKDGLSYMLSA
jgi:hypothetical protein